jgi:hypothetical protein
MKIIILTVFIVCAGRTAFSQISCSELFEAASALKNGSIKGTQINKDTLESTIRLRGQIESYIKIEPTIDMAYFILFRTISETEAMNKFGELKELLKKCKPADQKVYENTVACSMIIGPGFYITATYDGGKDNPDFTVLLRITYNHGGD